MRKGNEGKKKKREENWKEKRKDVKAKGMFFLKHPRNTFICLFQKPVIAQSHSVDLCTENCTLFFEGIKVKAVVLAER